MLITRKEVEYKIGAYRISVETQDDKSQVFVFDGNNNLLVSCLSLKEAEGIANALLQVVKKELDEVPF